VRVRKTFEIAALCLLVAVGVAFIAYPSIRDQSSCDSSIPANSAQRSALDKLKSIKAAECEGLGKGCQYTISQEDNGFIRIHFYDIHGATGSECLSIDCCWEDHIFTATGEYVRCDGCAA
jgi:hypothetical protein